MRRFIIDTDTASDDSMALLMAVRNPYEIRVEALTVVAGNVPLEQCVQNALYTLELANSSTIPVYSGAAGPLKLSLGLADFVHGKDGLGDAGLELKGRIPATGYAVDKLIELANQYPGEIELILLGPQTNVALAIQKDPSFAKKIKHCFVMGGTGKGPGNITPHAEFNIWVDPHAVEIVLNSELKMTWVGWDVTTKFANIYPEDMQEIQALGTQFSEHFILINQTCLRFKQEKIKENFIELADPICMAVALNPSIITRSERVQMQVHTSDDASRGALKISPNGQINLVNQVIQKEFRELLWYSMH